MLLLHKCLILMGWRAQVGSRGERLDWRASSEPTEGCDCSSSSHSATSDLITLIHSQPNGPSYSGKLGAESLPSLGEREFFKLLHVFNGHLAFRWTAPHIYHWRSNTVEHIVYGCQDLHDIEPQTCQIRL